MHYTWASLSHQAYSLAADTDPSKPSCPMGTAVGGMEYDCSHYLVDMHITLSEGQTGYRPILEKVPHPFFPEDHKESPSGMPMFDFPAVQCLHCGTSSPVWERGAWRNLCWTHDPGGISDGKLPFGSQIFRSAKDLPRQSQTDISDRAVQRHM